MTITTRGGKGSELTHAELDENFTDLRDGVDLKVPSDQTKGIKVDSLGTPSFGWHDIHGTPLFDPADPNGASMAVYRGQVRQLQMNEAEQIFINFHMPHDYLMGSNLFIHVHWSHNSATCTGGSVTWAFETMYSKGFDQENFNVPKTVSILQNASTTPYRHMVAEGSLSIDGGSATQLDTSLLEVDGIIFCRFSLDSNDITDSVSQPAPFVHFVDIHYQSTNVATKNRSPSFW